MKARRIGWIGLGLVLAVAVVLLLNAWSGRRLTPFPGPMPEPNGYHDLIQASLILQSPEKGWADLDGPNLVPWIRSNSNAWERLGLGLSRECRVPVQCDEDYMAIVSARLPGLKSLAQALAAQARWAEAEGQTNQAVLAYLDLVRLGQKVSAGGLLIDGLVGISIEYLGLIPLGDRLEQLDRAGCDQALETLKAVDAAWETADEYIRREEDWARVTYPYISWIMRVQTMLPWSGPGASLKKAQQQFASKLQSAARQRRTRIVSLTLRAYALEYGHPPAHPNDLIPQFLQSLPVDPETGQEIPWDGEAK